MDTYLDHLAEYFQTYKERYPEEAKDMTLIEFEQTLYETNQIKKGFVAGVFETYALIDTKNTMTTIKAFDSVSELKSYIRVYVNEHERNYPVEVKAINDAENFMDISDNLSYISDNRYKLIKIEFGFNREANDFL